MTASSAASPASVANWGSVQRAGPANKAPGDAALCSASQLALSSHPHGAGHHCAPAPAAVTNAASLRPNLHTPAGSVADEVASSGRPASVYAGSAATVVASSQWPMTPTTCGSVVSLSACSIAIDGSPLSSSAINSTTCPATPPRA